MTSGFDSFHELVPRHRWYQNGYLKIINIITWEIILNDDFVYNRMLEFPKVSSVVENADIDPTAVILTILKCFVLLLAYILPN